MTPKGVIRLNQLVVGLTGEPHALQSEDLLESACANPRNRWHYENVNDVVVLATALLLALARNHPFLQGNKRSAFEAMIGFLGANGYLLEISDHTPNADYMVAAIEGRMTDEEFTEALRPGVVRF